jgi:S1-C subfamily serine protease
LLSSVLSSQFYYPAVTGTPTRGVSDLVKQIGEAVVQVRTPGGLGSGFFINADGYLITNFHVIEGETEISVEVYHQTDGQLDRETYKQVKIIAINKFHDLALLHIEDKNAPKFKYVTLGNSDALTVGDAVFAIGSPLGLERTVTSGILSTKTRELEGQLYLQTSAQINPGNSGGPLFNLAGEVVGVTNMKITFGEGLGFAIPAELVATSSIIATLLHIPRIIRTTPTVISIRPAARGTLFPPPSDFGLIGIFACGINNNYDNEEVLRFLPRLVFWINHGNPGGHSARGKSASCRHPVPARGAGY